MVLALDAKVPLFPQGTKWILERQNELILFCKDRKIFYLSRNLIFISIGTWCLQAKVMAQ